MEEYGANVRFFCGDAEGLSLGGFIRLAAPTLWGSSEYLDRLCPHRLGALNGFRGATGGRNVGT